MLKSLAGCSVLTRRAARLLSQRAVVLCYHDLREDDEPASWMTVSRRDFAAQLDWLAELGDFVAPDALLAPEDPRPGRLRLLVTFDDGKPNNLRIAAPTLRARRIPALFFLSTWHLDTGEPFWFDRVVGPIQLAALSQIDLRDCGLRRYRFRPGPPAARWEDLQALLQELKALAPETDPAVEQALQAIARASGLPAQELAERLRPLNWDEAAELAGDGLLSCGSHGHRHVILTRLDDAALAANLRDSRAALLRRLGRDTDAIAYPNGDADARVRAAAGEAGFRLGFLTRPGLAAAGGDLLALPRLLIGGYDGLRLLRFKLNRVLLPAAARAALGLPAARAPV